MKFAGRRVAVIGLGESGVAAVRVLREVGADVVATERRSADEVGDAAAAAGSVGAVVHTGGHEQDHLDGVDLVVVSPGVPERAEVLTWASARGLPVWSELELGARIARCPYVAVTGTNGKTTTTEMTAAVMREDGIDAIACGNVGYPFSLAALDRHEALVVEASSFQLRFVETFHPKVSAILNLAPDHLDWHGTVDAYRDAKRRIFALQGPGDAHVTNRDDAAAEEASATARCDVRRFTLSPPDAGEVGYADGELISRLGPDPVSLGSVDEVAATHRANAAAAAAVALSFGVDAGAAGRALRLFPPLPHHGETVAVIDGVAFVDDSKATNPHAALATLRGHPGSVVVCGGRSKGIDLSPMSEAVGDLIGAVVLGEAADELEGIFAGRIPVRRAASIEEAVASAFAMARPGTSVVLAPACSSWDMFTDYHERGDRFTAAARALSGKETVHGERR